MDSQDKKINSNIVLAAMAAIILGILIAFYYSYAQSKSQINFLEEQKAILTKDLTLMKADFENIKGLNEVAEIEIQKSRESIDQLLDSVRSLTNNIKKLSEYKTELRKLNDRNDSLLLKNNFLNYRNMKLVERNEEIQKEFEKIRAAKSKAEAEKIRITKEAMEVSKTKVYVEIETTKATSIRVRNGKPIQTNKASVVSKLQGCVILKADASLAGTQKILYYQFLGPSMEVIEDNANTVNVNGNVYSKRKEFIFDGSEMDVCNTITFPQGSLKKGTYRLNVFEDEKLLSTTEYQLK